MQWFRAVPASSGGAPPFGWFGQTTSNPNSPSAADGGLARASAAKQPASRYQPLLRAFDFPSPSAADPLQGTLPPIWPLADVVRRCVVAQHAGPRLMVTPDTAHHHDSKLISTPTGSRDSGGPRLTEQQDAAPGHLLQPASSSALDLLLSSTSTTAAGHQQTSSLSDSTSTKVPSNRVLGQTTSPTTPPVLSPTLLSRLLESHAVEPFRLEACARRITAGLNDTGDDDDDDDAGHQGGVPNVSEAEGDKAKPTAAMGAAIDQVTVTCNTPHDDQGEAAATVPSSALSPPRVDVSMLNASDSGSGQHPLLHRPSAAALAADVKDLSDTAASIVASTYLSTVVSPPSAMEAASISSEALLTAAVAALCDVLLAAAQLQATLNDHIAATWRMPSSGPGSITQWSPTAFDTPLPGSPNAAAVPRRVSNPFDQPPLAPGLGGRARSGSGRRSQVSPPLVPALQRPLPITSDRGCDPHIPLTSLFRQHLAVNFNLTAGSPMARSSHGTSPAVLFGAHSPAAPNFEPPGAFHNMNNTPKHYHTTTWALPSAAAPISPHQDVPSKARIPSPGAEEEGPSRDDDDNHTAATTTKTQFYQTGFGQSFAAGFSLAHAAPPVVPADTPVKTSHTAGAGGFVHLSPVPEFEQMALASPRGAAHLVTHSQSVCIGEADPVDGSVQVNQYVLMQELGQGAQGTVHLAYDTIKQQVRAIKVIDRPTLLSSPGRPSVVGDYAVQSVTEPTGSPATNRSLVGSVRSRVEGSRRAAQLAREVAVMKRCRHRHLVQLHEVIDDPQHENMFLVMEYIPGGPLFRLDKSANASRTFTLSQVAHYGKQIASALAYLHKHGVIHCDIKPDNILLGDNDAVYLADFGVAEMLDSMGEAAADAHVATAVADLLAASLRPTVARRQSRRRSTLDSVHHLIATTLDARRVSGSRAAAAPAIDTSTTSPQITFHKNQPDAPPLPVMMMPFISSPDRGDSGSTGSNTPVASPRGLHGGIHGGTVAFFPPELLLPDSPMARDVATSTEKVGSNRKRSKSDLASQKARDPPRDVYALGVTFHLMLLGRLPHDMTIGIVPFITDVCEKDVVVKRWSFDEPEGLPRRWAELLEAMLSRHPSRRPKAVDVLSSLLHVNDPDEEYPSGGNAASDDDGWVASDIAATTTDDPTMAMSRRRTSEAAAGPREQPPLSSRTALEQQQQFLPAAAAMAARRRSSVIHPAALIPRKSSDPPAP